MAALFAVLLLVVLLVLPWFRSTGPGLDHATITGWNSLRVLRWLILVAVACGLLLAYFQQTRRAPALPVVMSVIVTAVALVTTIALVIRLPTSAGTPQLGAYLGVVCAAGIGLGGFWSMRDEEGWQPGPDRPIERVSLPSATRR